jgi:hypothetical protein
MADPNFAPVVIQAAVEGDLDEAVVSRLFLHAGAVLGRVHGGKGRGKLEQRLQGYNHAAQNDRWFVLVDLDRDECAAALRREWLPDPNRLMCFRIAVRAVESWLLADREAIASFLGLEISRIPSFPESEPNPKRTLVNLARDSRSSWIRKALVPRASSQADVGPAYSSMMKEYVRDYWRPGTAAECSDSLRRCLARLRELVEAV